VAYVFNIKIMCHTMKDVAHDFSSTTIIYFINSFLIPPF
jgi:hypothetical protein